MAVQLCYCDVISRLWRTFFQDRDKKIIDFSGKSMMDIKGVFRRKLQKKVFETDRELWLFDNINDTMLFCRKNTLDSNNHPTDIFALTK